MQLSRDHRHLLGSDYQVRASGATPFGPVPATREENAADLERTRRERKMGGPPPYRHAGSVKPMNSLNSATIQAGARNNGSFFSRFRNPADALATSTSRGSNVPKRRFPDGDRDRMQQPPFKKRQRDSEPPITSDSIDLTGEGGDDYTGATVITRNTSKPASASQGSRNTNLRQQKPPSSQLDTFGNFQIQAADEYLLPSRQASGALRVRQHGTKSAPVNVEDDELPRASGRMHPAPMTPSQAVQPDSRPVIDLEKGVDKYVCEQQERRRKNYQGSTRDIQEITSVFQRNEHRSGSSAGKLSAAMSRRIQQQQSAAEFEARAKDTSQRQFPSQPGTLASTFHRDDGDDEIEDIDGPSTNTTSQRRNATARSTSSGEGSPDELQGARTVPPRSSRSTSPQKRAQVPFKPPSKIYGTGSKRKSPPDAQATNHQNIHAQPKRSKRDHQEPVADVDDTHDSDSGDRIPVRAIYCKAFASNAKQLELVWNQDFKAYNVVFNKAIMPIPNTSRPIFIGDKDVKDITYNQEGHLGMLLKGPAGEISNGQIVIEFENASDLDDFRVSFLHDSSQLKSHSMSAEHMEKIVQTQSKAQLKVHEIAASNPAPMAPGKTQLRQGRLVQSTPAADDEQIVYEDDEDNSKAAVIINDSMAAAILQENYQEPRVGGKQATGRVSQHFQSEQPRRTTRNLRTTQTKQRTPTPPPVFKWTEENGLPTWKHPVTWPLQSKKRVTVEAKDMACLDNDEFLNDNVINFELRYIEEHMDARYKEKVHFFNTFLFETLTKNGLSKGVNYAGVQRWTKSVDIFTLPYVVVPINLNLHWFVAIICNLDNIQRKFADSDDVEPSKAATPAKHPDPTLRQDVEDDDLARLQPPDREMDELSLSDDGVVTKGSSDNGQPADGSEIFEFGDHGRVLGGEVEDEQSRHRAGKASGKKTKRGPSLQKYDTREPIIITLDSFGIGRSREVGVLKHYLSLEAKEKRNMELDPKSFPAMTAKGIPEQLNFSDCGVYLLGYIQKFAQNPDGFIRKILQREMNEEKDFKDFDPVEKRNEVREKLLEISAKHEKIHADARKAKDEAKKKAAAEQQSREASANRLAPSNGQTPSRPMTPSPAPTRTAGGPMPTEKPVRSHQPTPARTIQYSPRRLREEEDPPQSTSDKALNPCPTSQTLAEGEDDLSVSPPKTLGSRNIRRSPARMAPRAGLDQVHSDESEEMLDFADDLPVTDTRRSTPLVHSGPGESKSALAALDETSAESGKSVEDSRDEPSPGDNALTPEATAITCGGRVARSPSIVSVQDEADDQREPSPEIPESQEQGAPLPVKTAGGKTHNDWLNL